MHDVGIDPITAFYSGSGRDHRRRTLDDILRFSDDELEQHHDFIQWLFPLRERSRFNASAPLVNARTVEAFRRDPSLRAAMLHALDRMLSFYGLQRRGDDITPADRTNLERWLDSPHNYLRLTRILKSLTLLGHGDAARSLYRALESIYREELAGRGRIPPETMSFWSNAVRD